MDMQYCKALSHNLKKFADTENTRRQQLVVVHNFKSTTSIEQLEKMKKVLFTLLVDQRVQSTY